VEASAAILAEHPNCNIVFLSMYDADENLFAAISSGGRGYLLKNVPAAKLISSLRCIENGEAAISGAMTMRILEEFSSHHNGSNEKKPPIDNILSQREIEVLKEIAIFQRGSRLRYLFP
jgi:DNA-binding NarL/FixJ family response regulator